MLTNAPTGVSWSIIPFPKSSSAEQYAEQLNICHRATGLVNAYVNQVLRATVDTEMQSGPDFRFTYQQATGNMRCILPRWPVTEILAAQWAPNRPPLSWTQIPPANCLIEHPTLGVYGSSAPSAAGEGGQSILIGGGVGGWGLGRNGFQFSVSYLNGWPHAGLTADALAGAQTITVDDVTGFGVTSYGGWTGASAWVYDGASTEAVAVSSVAASSPMTLPNGGGTAQAGPGTVTLAQPLLYDHPAGTVVSALPQDILWATVLAATTQALESGITAVTIQNVTGSQTVGGHGVEDLELMYERILEPYRRVI